MSIVCTWMSLVHHSYATHLYSYVIRMSLVRTRIFSVCTRMMYSYVIRMSLACTCMSPVCHSYRLSYVTRMPLVCTRMSSVFHSSVVLPWTLPKVNLSQCLADDLRILLRINELILFHSDLSFSCYWKKNCC